jgi:hypothetical protein
MVSSCHMSHRRVETDVACASFVPLATVDIQVKERMEPLYYMTCLRQSIDSEYATLLQQQVPNKQTLVMSTASAR